MYQFVKGFWFLTQRYHLFQKSSSLHFHAYMLRHTPLKCSLDWLLQPCPSFWHLMCYGFQCVLAFGVLWHLMWEAITRPWGPSSMLLVLLTVTGHSRGVSLQFHVLLEADPFLNKLTKLYERNKAVGSVWVTVKRCKLSKLSTRLSLCICSLFYQSIRPVQTKLGVLHLGSVA